MKNNDSSLQLSTHTSFITAVKRNVYTIQSTYPPYPASNWMYLPPRAVLN